MVNNQSWLGQLELLCERFSDRNPIVSSSCMEERDRLIEFGNRLVNKHSVPRQDVVMLIDRVDQQLFGAE